MAYKSDVQKWLDIIRGGYAAQSAELLKTGTRPPFPYSDVRQLSEYGIGLSPNQSNPENAVRDLVAFLPVLAFDGANMTQIDAGGILDSPEAMAAVDRIEGWRALGDNVIETIINKSEKVKALKNKAKNAELSAKEKKELSAEEKEYKSKRKLVQEKLIKFATRIPAL